MCNDDTLIHGGKEMYTEGILNLYTEGRIKGIIKNQIWDMRKIKVSWVITVF